MLTADDLLALVTERFLADQTIKSAVLFGSRARSGNGIGTADQWSDLDLHIITSAPAALEDRAWAASLPGVELCLHFVRPIPAGVRKVTILSTAGEANLVLLPAGLLRAVRLAARFGLHRRWKFLRFPLNEMATVMKGGYRFIKGERAWGGFYAQVTSEMPGRRIDDRAAALIADNFLWDFLRLIEKLERSELIEAQRLLHNFLLEDNLKLLEESRERRKLLTYGGARRAEKLLPPEELSRIRVSARLDADELRAAAWQAREALEYLMAGLVPAWRPPASFGTLANPLRPGPQRPAGVAR
jgi:hypothetical protein